MSLQNTTTSDEVSKLVKDYLNGFANKFKIKNTKDVDLIHDWCKANCGLEFKDWFLYRGSSRDPFVVLRIKDPKKSTLFLLTWSEMLCQA
jgi:hypothetical protein